VSKNGKKEKRSPLKRRPLRSPGDSIQTEIERITDDLFMPALVLALLLVFLAVYEWWQLLTAQPPRPLVMSILAAAAILYCAYQFVTLRKRVRSLNLGRDGERAVAQYLEANRQPEWRLFHDVLAGGFNVDHVLIAPQGVFVLETKTFSKPNGGNAKIFYDGNKVLVDGHSPDRDPVAQAGALRDWVRDMFIETTSKRVPVRGVVVFPGWWIDQPPKGGSRPDVWVLNERALPKWIANEPTVLQDSDIALLASALVYHMTRE